MHGSVSIRMPSQKDFSRWCFYFHHYCSILMGQYAFCYDRSRRKFGKSILLLIGVAIVKLLIILSKPVVKSSFIRNVSSMPGSLLPVILYFAIDQNVFIHQISLLVNQLTSSKMYLSLLNENLCLEENLLTGFPNVQLRKCWIYEQVVPSKLALMITCFFLIGNELDHLYAVVSFFMFLDALTCQDQFRIWIENIKRSVEILHRALEAVQNDLRYLTAGYQELEYCETIRKLADAHYRVHRHFKSVQRFYSWQIFQWLMLVCNGLLLLMFMLFGFVNALLYDHSTSFRNVLSGIVLIVIIFLHLISFTKRCVALTEKQRQLEKLIQSVAFTKLNDDRLRQMVRFLLLQIKHEKMTVVCCSVVTFDYTLILTIIAFITKYLVLLIQFHLQGNYNVSEWILNEDRQQLNASSEAAG